MPYRTPSPPKAPEVVVRDPFPRPDPFAGQRLWCIDWPPCEYERASGLRIDARELHRCPELAAVTWTPKLLEDLALAIGCHLVAMGVALAVVAQRMSRQTFQPRDENAEGW